MGCKAVASCTHPARLDMGLYGCAVATPGVNETPARREVDLANTGAVDSGLKYSQEYIVLAGVQLRVFDRYPNSTRLNW